MKLTEAVLRLPAPLVVGVLDLARLATALSAPEQASMPRTMTRLEVAAETLLRTCLEQFLSEVAIVVVPMGWIRTRSIRLVVTLLLALAVLGGWRAGPPGEAAPLAIEKIAFAQGFVSFRGDEFFDIFTMNPDGSKKRNLTRNRGDDPAWSPDGQKIAFTRGVSDGPGYNIAIFVMNADGSRQHRVLHGRTGFIASPSWSPDGQEIVFVRQPGNAVNDFEIWVMNADGTNLRQLTSNTSDDFAPDWSGDGKQIVFVRGRIGKREIWIMNADGTGERRLTRNAVTDDSPDWSRDHRRIVFSREQDLDRIWVMNADGSGQRPVLRTRRGEGIEPTWSPDGRRIVFVRDNDVWVMNADGTGQRQLTRNPTYDDGDIVADDPEWSQRS